MRISNIFMLGYIAILDYIGRESSIYNNSVHISKAMEWLCRAQDSTDDGGVSEGYHLYHGWLPSYPETTGYIIESFYDYYHLTGDMTYQVRAVRMADWLVSIQGNDGSIPDSYFKKKMVFDTGQVIFGLVRSYEETKMQKFKIAAEKAGEWLLSVQENDGSWQKYTANEIPHAYYTRVAWSLLVLHSITKQDKFCEACVRNIEWTLKQQEANGWFNNASFSLKDHNRPFTHTIAYTIDGVLEAGFYLQEMKFIDAARNAIDNIFEHIQENGCIPGTFDRQWGGDDAFSCLTGNAQLAINLFKLYAKTKNHKYLETAKEINAYLKRKQETRIQNRRVHGAIAGSHPIWGKYIHYTYPNWASKFFIDSLMMEEKIVLSDREEEYTIHMGF